MATVTAVPVDIYLRSTFEPDAEYVDGEIQERPVGEYDHAAWQSALIIYFRQHTADWKVRVQPELRVQVGEMRFRVPDVTVLDRDQPIEQIVTHPPIAVFEVLSPDDVMARMLVKLADYERMGIQGIFVVDPKGSKYRFANGSLTPVPLGPTACGRLTINFEEIESLVD
jgi:Uma2 family endonuclease